MIPLKQSSKIACSYSSGILTFVAFLLWLLSISQAKLNLTQIGMGNLGLITILPITFFISISLLIFSFFINLRSNKNQIILFFQTITLISFLNFTPTLIEGTARFDTTCLKLYVG